MRLDVRPIESAEALELYVSAAPERGRDGALDAHDMFAAAAAVVKAHGARVCRERVFVPEGQLAQFQDAHRQSFPAGDAEVPSDWLWAGGKGAVGGVQLYALRGVHDWKPLRTNGHVAGWSFRQNGHRWAVTGAVDLPHKADGAGETSEAFAVGEEILKEAGMDLSCVARTWFFLDHILDWYANFNQVRNRLFIDRGLLRKGQKAAEAEVPASTGMGVSPATGHRVALELFAVAGPAGTVKRYAASGKQRSAYEYGSAFARASEAHTPAGRTVFISGTAAIDESGATCFVGDAAGQVRMTMDNLVAVLRDTHCAGKDVVQAIAYCKTPEIAEMFEKKWLPEVPWPWVVVIGDVCRDDLLFEAEVTACEASQVVHA